MVLCVRWLSLSLGFQYCTRADLHTGHYVLRATRGKFSPFRRNIMRTSQGYGQFYEFLQVDWAKKLTYSQNMYILTYLKARELSW